MGDRVTRQFVDEVTGDPITGAQFRLASKTDPLYAPVGLVEIPDQIPGTPDGKYASPSTVQTGVYAIERFQGGAWNETGDELTVQPGRWRAPWASENIVADHLGAVLRVSGFMFPEDTTTIGELNIILSYAADNGYDVVEVGGHRGVFAWVGESALVIPDDLTVDLLGATVQCTTEDIAPVECAGAATIMNGKIAGSGTGASQHITSTDPAKEITCIGIEFTGLGSNHLTISTSAAAVAKATFISCSNVVVPAVGSESVASQVIVGGRQNATQLGGGAFVPPAHAFATGTEIGDLIRFLQSAAAPAGAEVPPASEPFTNMRQVAAAIRNLWFVQKPLIGNAANSISLLYAKADGDSGIGNGNSSTINATVNIAPYPAVTVTPTVERKVEVVGSGKYRSVKLYISSYSLLSYTFSNPIDADTNVFGKVTYPIADFVADLRSVFPGTDLKGYKARTCHYIQGVSNVTNPRSFFTENVEASKEVIRKVDNPSTIEIEIPEFTLRFGPANAKAFVIHMTHEIDLYLFDDETSNGLFQRYATIASPSV